MDHATCEYTRAHKCDFEEERSATYVFRLKRDGFAWREIGDGIRVRMWVGRWASCSKEWNGYMIHVVGCDWTIWGHGREEFVDDYGVNINEVQHLLGNERRPYATCILMPWLYFVCVYVEVYFCPPTSCKPVARTFEMAFIQMLAGRWCSQMHIRYSAESRIVHFHNTHAHNPRDSQPRLHITLPLM